MQNLPDIQNRLFDEWPDRYDEWFQSPIGALVKHYESLLLLDLLQPCRGEMILDVGCGTGIFTLDVLESGPNVVGLEISQPMLMRARQKIGAKSFHPITGDMLSLPIADEVFDKMIFRSPDEMCTLAPVDGVVKTAIHFQKDEDPDRAPEIEREGQTNNLNTGAILAVCWEKP
jgi:SAM-dependent methyltransferase